jgi:hypothetical protein
MNIIIIHEAENYRLIANGEGHYAVIEARGGRVYSLHSHARSEAPDTPEGMAAVVGDGWRNRQEARERFLDMLRCEKRYSEVLW